MKPAKRKPQVAKSSRDQENLSFTIFETAIGSCGLAWSSTGIARLLLPDRESRKVVSRLERETARQVSVDKLPTWVAKAVKAMQDHLEGSTSDFQDIPLDLAGQPPFHARVYMESRRIPPGQVVTYGELATRIGSPKSARAVGQALGRNPVALIVPCHRVVASGSKPGGFSAPGGLATKAAILQAEGYQLSGGSGVGVSRKASSKSIWDPKAACRALSKNDSTMQKLIKAVGPVSVVPKFDQDPFEALTESIVYQQLTAKAAGTIFGRVKALFPHGGMPTPQDIADVAFESLRGAGLSNAKALAMKDLAAKALAGEIPDVVTARQMSDEELVEVLTRVRGIGRWTVEMLLIFTLGRPDVFPSLDYGVRKGFAVTYGKKTLPTAKEIQAFAERWQPHRSIAAWYFWRALDLDVAKKRKTGKSTKKGTEGRRTKTVKA